MALVLTFTFMDSLKGAMYQDADQLHSPGYQRQLLGFKIEEAHWLVWGSLRINIINVFA